jgi:uncharacterized protein (TIGR02145 family)
MKKYLSTPFVLAMAISCILTACNSTVDVSSVAITGQLSEVTTTSAKCSGSIQSGSNVIDCGICMATYPDPTINGSVVSSFQNSGSFTCSITDLLPDMTYYVRAYATTSEDTEYGKVIQLTTPAEAGNTLSILNPDLTYGKVSDIDGNEYHTINIGTQTWMVENLSVTKFRNGEAIPTVTDNGKWEKLKTAAQCNYNNNAEANSIRKFGRLYNYFAVKDARNIAPEGWHVATAADWNKLTDYLKNNLGVSKSVAQALASKTDWVESQFPNSIGSLDPETFMPVNNTSGFAALPAGIRADYGLFTAVGVYGSWWVAGETNGNNAGFRSMNNYGSIVGQNNYNQRFGLSVRCIKD